MYFLRFRSRIIPSFRIEGHLWFPVQVVRTIRFVEEKAEKGLFVSGWKPEVTCKLPLPVTLPVVEIAQEE